MSALYSQNLGCLLGALFARSILQHTLSVVSCQNICCANSSVSVPHNFWFCCRPTFEQITKDLQLLYGEARKKPLQSATSAPASVASKKLSANGPPAPAAPPLRIRPSTADTGDLPAPRVVRSDFHSVTDAQPVKSRSRAGTVSEQDEQPPSPFAAVRQDPSPPRAQARPPQEVSTTAAQQGVVQPRVGGIPSLAEAQQRMATAPTPFMPPASMMRSNPRTSMTWRSPEHVSLQIPEESDINALADQMSLS